MKLKAKIMDEPALKRALMRISHEIVEKNKGADNIVLIGILRRGAEIGKIIAENIETIEGKKISCRHIDIHSYRDDITAINDGKIKTGIEADVNDKDIILIDDVIYTGRSVRAAIEAIFSCGRPRTIQLAVLIDRGHRELPIRPDYVGKSIPTSRNELVEVRMPQFDGETGVFLME